MNKLLMKIKRGMILPMVAIIGFGTATPAAAYTSDFDNLIRRIIALFAPLLNSAFKSKLARARMAAHAARFRKAPAPIPGHPMPTKRVNLETPELFPNKKTETPAPQPAPAPETKPAEKPAEPQASAHAQAHAHHEHNEHEETLAACIDKLQTCVHNAAACKQQFLNPNVTRSYREFKKDFDANLAALHVVSAYIANTHGLNEHFKTLHQITDQLIHAQSSMCNALNGNYGSGMTLGWSLNGVEKPTSAARAKIKELTAKLHKTLRGKNHTLKKVTTLAQDINTLLASPTEQGLSVGTLLSICSKRV